MIKSRVCIALVLLSLFASSFSVSGAENQLPIEKTKHNISSENIASQKVVELGDFSKSEVKSLPLNVRKSKKELADLTKVKKPKKHIGDIKSKVDKLKNNEDINIRIEIKQSADEGEFEKKWKQNQLLGQVNLSRTKFHTYEIKLTKDKFAALDFA